MKKIGTNIDFADSTFRSCEIKDNELKVILNSWDEQIIEIIFHDPIQLNYSTSSFISGLYEMDEENDFLNEALKSYYDKAVPLEHSFKSFVITDIEDFCFLKVIAKSVDIVKIRHGKI